MNSPSSDPVRAFTRHMIATLAYRGAKVLRGAPAAFAETRCAVRSTDLEVEAEKSRTPVQVLAHIADLLAWTARLVEGGQDPREAWRASPARTWDHEVDRFFRGLEEVDAVLLQETAPAMSLERIFQGPISDAFTHIGQLAYLRRLAGSPVRGEVMVLAEVVPGRLGPDQAPPSREFD